MSAIVLKDKTQFWGKRYGTVKNGERQFAIPRGGPGKGAQAPKKVKHNNEQQSKRDRAAYEAFKKAGGVMVMRDGKVTREFNR